MVLGSKIRFENKKDKVCRKVMCLLCRFNWEDAEKYMSYCNTHHSDNHVSTESTKLGKSQKEKSIVNTRASDNKKSRKAQKKQYTKVIKKRKKFLTIKIAPIRESKFIRK